MPRMRMSDEPGDVEGHAVRWNGRDAEGNEFDIPGDRITKVWTEDGTAHDVEGHMPYRRLDQEPEVEGHGFQVPLPDGQRVDLSQVSKIAFTDDDGNEQEVEGHMARMR